MQFGYFDELKREYVITNPRTPVKWINYIGTRQFGGFLDHTGGSLLCKDDPTFNRITKYIQQMPSSDFKGTTLYLRTPSTSNGEEAAQSYRVFSPFFVPTLNAYQHFECRVGLGYTRWITEFFNLRAEIVIFVPLRGTCELRDFQITNLGGEPVVVDAIPMVEYTHPDALKQFTNADWVPQTMQSKAVEDGEFKILIQYPFMYRDTRINYLTSNLPASSFETDRKCFLGENEYGTFKFPLSLQQPELRDTQALRGDNIAALLHHLGTLQPGMIRRLIIQFGQVSSLEAVRSEIHRLRNPEEVEKEFERIRDFWEGYLSALQVNTPDQNTNAMLNVYNPHQCYVTKTWSRYLSYYQLGLGSRGIGIRDSSQDVLSVMASVPDESREFLRSLLSFQKRDGSAMHQFNPLTLEGSVGDSAEMEDRPHYYSDDHLWCILAGIAYLKETGDLSFLDEFLPFYDKDKQGRSLESGSVFEHFKRGFDFTQNDLGQHGLPLLGYADWNDTVNLPTGAESLFTANLYGKALLEMMALLEHIRDISAAKAYRMAYEEMRARVESTAWDGEWYIRYLDADGNPTGRSISTGRHGQLSPVSPHLTAPARPWTPFIPGLTPNTASSSLLPVTTGMTQGTEA
jgi:cellobiose phosphorylase